MTRHHFYLATVTQCITAAFNELTLDGCYAAGDGFHCLEQCIQYGLFQFPAIKMRLLHHMQKLESNQMISKMIELNVDISESISTNHYWFLMRERFGR